MNFWKIYDGIASFSEKDYSKFGKVNQYEVGILHTHGFKDKNSSDTRDQLLPLMIERHSLGRKPSSDWTLLIFFTYINLIAFTPHNQVFQ